MPGMYRVPSAPPFNAAPNAIHFCSNFGEAAPEMLGMYEVPHIFRHDLFACLGYRREDYRWAGQAGFLGWRASLAEAACVVPAPFFSSMLALGLILLSVPMSGR